MRSFSFALKAAHIVATVHTVPTMMHVRQVPYRQTLGVDICHTPSVSTTYMYAEVSTCSEHCSPVLC
jgi:hypothetical protein